MLIQLSPVGNDLFVLSTMSELLIDTLKRNLLQKAFEIEMQMDMDTVAGAEVPSTSQSTSNMRTEIYDKDCSAYTEAADTYSQLPSMSKPSTPIRLQ